MADEQVDGPSDSFIGKYYTRLRIGKYKSSNPFKESTFGEGSIYVYLPLPSYLADENTIGYSPVNLEAVGDIMGEGSTLDDILLRTGGNMISGGLGMVTGKVGSDIVKGLFPAEKINSYIQQTTGVAPNPNPSVAFQGPMLRNFSYKWSFYPKNKKESEKINSNIKLLKSRALPTFNKKPSTILNYPYMCQLNFFPWDDPKKSKAMVDDHDHGWTENSIIRYKRCFMDNVTVRYNPYGTQAFFEDSNLPVSYELSISFKEIEYMVGQDWDSSFDPGYKEFNSIKAIFNGVAKVVGTAFGTVSGVAEGLVKDTSDIFNGPTNDVPPTPQSTTDQKSTIYDSVGKLGVGDNPLGYVVTPVGKQSNQENNILYSISRTDDGYYIATSTPTLDDTGSVSYSLVSQKYGSKEEVNAMIKGLEGVYIAPLAPVDNKLIVVGQ